MSQLPGARHRALAASSILREVDVAAAERGIAALKFGSHAPRTVDWGIYHLADPSVSWTSFDAGMTYRIATAGLQFLIGDLPLDAGADLMSISFTLRQADVTPILVRVEQVIALEGAPPSAGILPNIYTSHETIAEDDETLTLATYQTKTLNLVSAARRSGLRLPTLATQRVRFMIRSGQGGDRLSGVELTWQKRPAGSP